MIDNQSKLQKKKIHLKKDKNRSKYNIKYSEKAHLKEQGSRNIYILILILQQWQALGWNKKNSKVSQDN